MYQSSTGFAERNVRAKTFSLAKNTWFAFIASQGIIIIAHGGSDGTLDVPDRVYDAIIKHGWEVVCCYPAQVAANHPRIDVIMDEHTMVTWVRLVEHPKKWDWDYYSVSLEVENQDQGGHFDVL